MIGIYTCNVKGETEVTDTGLFLFVGLVISESYLKLSAAANRTVRL